MPEVIPNQEANDEKVQEQEEREQSRLLRDGEKNHHLTKERAMEREIKKLRKEMEALRKELKKAKSTARSQGSDSESKIMSRRVSLLSHGGLLAPRTYSMFGSGSNLVVDDCAIEPKQRHQYRHKLNHIEEPIPDPEIDELYEKMKGKFDNTVLKKVKVKERETKDKSRSGFRMMMESREENTVDIVRVNHGTFQLPSLTRLRVRVKFIKKPRKVLIIKKPGDKETLEALQNVIEYLSARGLEVVCEVSVKEEVAAVRLEKRPTFLLGPAIRDADIDFIVSLGGDGTILWACGLFPEGMPPVVSFKLGSLGFLTPFPIASYQQILRDILKKDKEVTVRARLKVLIKTKGKPDQIMSCLNEVVAKHPSKMVSLDLYNNEHMLTTAYADGLIVATPTGSTAYSLAAGGSMVHPAIPAMVVTPIAPHTLSFRPIVMADSSTLRLVVPENARNKVHVTLDGRNSIELDRGDEVQITVSQYPVAAFCKDGESGDWFNAIKNSFSWNERTQQKKMS